MVNYFFVSEPNYTRLATFPPEGWERCSPTDINDKADDHGKNPCTAA